VRERRGESATGDPGSGGGLRHGEQQWLDVEVRWQQWSDVSSPRDGL
jgi:hypothetical protein